tara:strand:+ start:1857 stop:2561 length:705 start_codon:yes stop_codon:yes gene_type:complete
MVINDPHSLMTLLDQFDPKNEKQFNILKKLIKHYPNFHIIQAYYLKAVQQLDPENFDKTLSHTAIATYNRELLYEFIEAPFSSIREGGRINANLSPDQIKTNDNQEKSYSEKKQYELPNSLRFSDWASYFRANKEQKKEHKITDKFKMIDSFLANRKKIVPDRDYNINEDLSEKSWTSPDELMTETLAKVFVKQKKYDKALEAFQILGLKYPEKNSFFANQIKKIKKMQKQKNN